MDSLTQRTMELLKAVGPNGLMKAGISQSTGLVYYSLEPAAKLLVPVLTPLRNEIPRTGPTTGGSGTAEHWKQITSFNALNVRAGVSEGNRGGALTFTEVDRVATYAGLGLEDFATFEAEYAGMGFEDVKALAAMATLQMLMVEEEKIILNGNNSLALGQAGIPVAVQSVAGNLDAQVGNCVYVVALTYAGLTSNGGPQNSMPNNSALQVLIQRTNMDGSTDTIPGGVGKISVESAAVATDAGHKGILATVPPTPGAAGYAWYLGPASGIATAKLVAITSGPKVTIIDRPGAASQAANYSATVGGQTATLSADNSTDPLVFDGLIATAQKFGGYTKSLNSGTLTADGRGGVVEVDAALKYFWDQYRLSPTAIWVDSQVIGDLTGKVASGTTNPTFRINLQNTAGSLGNMVAGSLVASYLNKYALNGVVELPVRLHPNMPTGTIYFDLSTNPYPNSRVPVPRRIKTRREYYTIEWPIVSRKYAYGVYVDELLQVYIPFGTGVITDIAAG